jgi:arginase
VPYSILLIDVPYDCGQFDARMGAGPTYLIDRGLADSLREAGHAVRRASVRLPSGFHTEWMAFAFIQEQIATLVRQAEQSGERVLILSGNCAPAALGVLSADIGADTAVVWFDAHAEFNTPETSPSGFLDGMGLAIALGHCWRARAPMFQTNPVPEEHVILVGSRAIDDEELVRLERSRVRRSAVDPEQVVRLLAPLSSRVRRAYLHVDLDVIDATELRANLFASDGGPSADQVSAVIAAVGARVPIGAASITALDPTIDGERGWSIARKLALTIAGCP